ncbi:hypothetical protein MMC12_001345 [Toensbergia leucococca]|nr:hypothetical protein [Toensbergia leucococca]
MTRQWLNNLVERVEKLPAEDLKDELRAFQSLFEGDVDLKILVSSMFTEVPKKEPYNRDPMLNPQVRSYQHMLQLLNHVMDSAPKWNADADRVGLVGFPISTILNWPMSTSSGNVFFLRPDVNEQWMKILNRWALYLGTSDSASVLTDEEDGWLSEQALKALTAKGNNGTTNYSFDELYVCDKSAKHFGFKSWDDFFTREFQPDKRPLPISGEDLFTRSALQGNLARDLPIRKPPDVSVPPALIYNACESSPVFLRRGNDVHEKAEFWLKGQPYSLTDMLANDPLTPSFVQGTVYQAFLSALSYHRWHSPVSGTIRRAFNVPGTYYSANYFQGFANPANEGGPDKLPPENSQAYTTQVAARAVIFMEADNEEIGLMCFVAVGMCEVSSNEITVAEGQHVDAGEQIGMFHYGGSTHCQLFRKGVDLVFRQEPNNGTAYDPRPEHNTPLRSVIAVVRRPSEKHGFVS